jgi:hypothetical protein
MLDIDGEFGCGPEAVATQLAGAAGEPSPATAVGRKRALEIMFTLCPKRTRPASERAATATSCERALDVQDAARSFEPDGTVSGHLSAAWPRVARAEARTPADAATCEAEAGKAARACQAQAGAGLSAVPRAPADSAHAEGALTLVDLPAHVIACVVDQLPGRRRARGRPHLPQAPHRIGAQPALGTRRAADDSPELALQLAAQAAVGRRVRRQPQP